MTKKLANELAVANKGGAVSPVSSTRICNVNRAVNTYKCTIINSSIASLSNRLVSLDDLGDNKEKITITSMSTPLGQSGGSGNYMVRASKAVNSKLTVVITCSSTASVTPPSATLTIDVGKTMSNSVAFTYVGTTQYSFNISSITPSSDSLYNYVSA